MKGIDDIYTSKIREAEGESTHGGIAPSHELSQLVFYVNTCMQAPEYFGRKTRVPASHLTQSGLKPTREELL